MRKALSITAAHGPYWRAGLKFGPEARVIALDALSDEQLQRIRDDPRLAVAGAELPDAEDQGTDPKGGDQAGDGPKAKPGKKSGK